MEKVPNIQALEELISKVIKDTIRIEITDHNEDLNNHLDSLDFEELLITLEDEVLEEYNIEIKFDTEVFEKEISIIEKILNTSGSNDYKGIIEEFRKCIS